MEKLRKIINFCVKHKSEIIKFLSNIVKIRSYSNEEDKLVKFIIKYLLDKQKRLLLQQKINVKTINNNIILFAGQGKEKILFDAHIDTIPVAQDNFNNWDYPPFSGKIIGNKVYGRGSCDDKSSVAALVFTYLYWLTLKKTEFYKEAVISLSSNEEDSSGKGIEEVLKFVKPTYAIICEPSDLKIVYGHKGKFACKVTFIGKPTHSSTPHLGRNAIYMALPLIKHISEFNEKAKFVVPLGKPVTSVTFIESKTNSLNSVPYECCVYIDYRSVLGETQESILKNIFNKLDKNIMRIESLHRYFPAWVLQLEHPLLKHVQKIFVLINNKKPQKILWPFCTNGSITCGEKNIPTIGFGPGKSQLAHASNEYVEISQVIEAIKFYTLIPLIS